MRGNTSFERRMSSKIQDSSNMGTGASRLLFAHSGEARIVLRGGSLHLKGNPTAR